jgi:hypothetical protein
VDWRDSGTSIYDDLKPVTTSWGYRTMHGCMICYGDLAVLSAGVERDDNRITVTRTRIRTGLHALHRQYPSSGSPRCTKALIAGSADRADWKTESNLDFLLHIWETQT